MKLRPAVSGDADAIAHVHTEARRDSLPYLPELHSDAETRDWVATIVLPYQIVRVATIDGVVVGYMAMDGAELNDLYVLTFAQSQGIGHALLTQAKQLSPGRLTLWTFQRNVKARAFYEHRGFKAVEFTDGRDNEEREPDVRYEWVSAASSAAGT